MLTASQKYRYWVIPLAILVLSLSTTSSIVHGDYGLACDPLGSRQIVFACSSSGALLQAATVNERTILYRFEKLLAMPRGQYKLLFIQTVSSLQRIDNNGFKPSAVCSINLIRAPPARFT